MKHKIEHSRSCSCIQCVSRYDYEKRPSERRLEINCIRREEKRHEKNYVSLRERKCIGNLLTNEEVRINEVYSGKKQGNNVSKRTNRHVLDEWSTVIGDAKAVTKKKLPYIGQSLELGDCIGCSCCIWGYDNYVTQHDSESPHQNESLGFKHSKEHKSLKISRKKKTKSNCFKAKYIRSDSTSCVLQHSSIKLVNGWSTKKKLGSVNETELKVVPSIYTCTNERSESTCININKLKNIQPELVSNLIMSPIPSEGQFGIDTKLSQICESKKRNKNTTNPIIIGHFASLDEKSKVRDSRKSVSRSFRTPIIKSSLKKMQILKRRLRNKASRKNCEIRLYKKSQNLELSSRINIGVQGKKKHSNNLQLAKKYENPFKCTYDVETNNSHSDRACGKHAILNPRVNKHIKGILENTTVNNNLYSQSSITKEASLQTEYKSSNFSLKLKKWISILKFHRNEQKKLVHTHPNIITRVDVRNKFKQKQNFPMKPKSKIIEQKRTIQSVRKLNKIEEDTNDLLDNIHKKLSTTETKCQLNNVLTQRHGLFHKDEFDNCFQSFNVQMGKYTTKRKDYFYDAPYDTRKLSRYECEPGICVPYECESKNRIDSRYKKLKIARTLSTDSNKNAISSSSAKLIASSKQTTPKTSISRSTQLIPETQTARGEVEYKTKPNRKYAEIEPTGSSFGLSSKSIFDFELYNSRQFENHGQVVDSKSKHNLKHIEEKNYHSQRSFDKYNTRNIISQFEVIEKKDRGVDLFLKRYLCKLGIRKKRKEIIDKQTKTTVTNTAEEVERKNVKFSKLGECEPGTCVLYEWEPYECLEQIKRRYQLPKGSSTYMLTNSDSSFTPKTNSKTKKLQTRRDSSINSECIGHKKHNWCAQTDYRKKFITAGVGSLVQICYRTLLMKKQQGLEQKKKRDKLKRHQKARSIDKLCLKSNPNSNLIPAYSCDRLFCKYNRNKNNSYFSRPIRNFPFVEMTSNEHFQIEDDIVSNKYTVQEYICNSFKCKSQKSRDEKEPKVAPTTPTCLCSSEQIKIKRNKIFDLKEKTYQRKDISKGLHNECYACNCKYFRELDIRTNIPRTFSEKAQRRAFIRSSPTPAAHESSQTYEQTFKKSNKDFLKRKQNKQEIKKTAENDEYMCNRYKCKGIKRRDKKEFKDAPTPTSERTKRNNLFYIYNLNENIYRRKALYNECNTCKNCIYFKESDNATKIPRKVSEKGQRPERYFIKSPPKPATREPYLREILNKCLCAFKKSNKYSLEGKENKQDMPLIIKEKYGSGDAGIMENKHNRVSIEAKKQKNKIRAKNVKEVPESQVDLIMPYSHKKFKKYISHTKLVRDHSLHNLSLPFQTNLSKRVDCCFCDNKTTITKKQKVNHKENIGVRRNDMDSIESAFPKISGDEKNKPPTKQKKKSTSLIKKKKYSNKKKKITQPSNSIFKLVFDSTNMSVLNTEEVNTALSKELKAVNLGDHLNHEKSCQCCVCRKKRNKQDRTKSSHPIKGHERKPDNSKYIKRNNKKNVCVCGSPICEKEYNKNRRTVEHNKRTINHFCECFVKRTVYKKIFKKNKMKKMNTRQRRKMEKRNQKREMKRLKKQMKQDTLRKKKRKKADKYNLKMLRKYQYSSDKVLLSECILDAARLSGAAIAGLGRISYRLASKPKTCCLMCRKAKEDPDEFFDKIKDTIQDSSLPGTITRIRQRIQSMRMVQAFMRRIENSPIGNFIIHIFDQNPKGRLEKKRRMKKRKEPNDFGCNLYMMSLRHRPWLWVYYSCGWFYPHCIGIATIGKKMLDVGMFILAVLVWSPCILAMELCRTVMCCTACTG